MAELIRILDTHMRLVIPRETLRALNLNAGDYVELHTDVVDGSSCLIITKKSDQCAICASKEELKPIKYTLICDECIEIIKQNDY